MGQEVSYGNSTALLVVDVQNDFADPRGSLYVPGGEEVVVQANAEIDKAQAAEAPVIYTQDWHPPVTPHFAKDGGVWPVHCVGRRWGSRLHPRLKVVGLRVRKGTGGEDGYSGFTARDPVSGAESPTALAGLLRRRGIEHVVVIGLATDYCVKETALDARRKGYAVTVLTRAIGAVDLRPGDGDRALQQLRDAGVAVI